MPSIDLLGNTIFLGYTCISQCILYIPSNHIIHTIWCLLYYVIRYMLLSSGQRNEHTHKSHESMQGLFLQEWVRIMTLDIVWCRCIVLLMLCGTLRDVNFILHFILCIYSYTHSYTYTIGRFDLQHPHLWRTCHRARYVYTFIIYIYIHNTLCICLHVICYTFIILYVYPFYTHAYILYTWFNIHSYTLLYIHSRSHQSPRQHRQILPPPHAFSNGSALTQQTRQIRYIH